MKNALRIISFLLAVAMILTLCACGADDDEDTGDNTAAESVSIFGKTDLADYVVLGEYKGIEVDTSSDVFSSALSTEMNSDISRYGLDKQSCYSDPQYSGKVQSGDIANIDYEGKRDGVAFSGGTAQGYDLTIGSHTFIEGFEDGLIGVNIGDTVDLNLTFPENYSKAELAGVAVVFTVKVNYVKSADAGKIYSQIGFDSKESYLEDLTPRAIKTLASNRVIGNCKISGAPKKDVDILFDAYRELTEAKLKVNNVTLEDALKSYNMTIADYKEQMYPTLEKEVKDSMVYYCILKNEGLGYEYDLPESEIKGQPVLDEMAKVKHVVQDFICDNAVIK